MNKIVDDIMVDADIEDILIFNSHENITVKIYNPGVNLGKNIIEKIKKFTTDFRSANQRMHNKTFIVDGKVVITGGRNIADEYFDYDHEYNWYYIYESNSNPNSDSNYNYDLNYHYNYIHK